MKILLRLLLKTQHQENGSRQAQTEKGMTLIELLIGMVIAFLIITPMLAFVVDMLNTDRREQVKANTEQDIQAAVDFIAQDLSQAIYIYDQKGINAINGSTTGKLPSPDKGTPILVFWKRQQIKNSLPINPSVAAKPNTCDKKPGQCNDTYVLSLVAYYQIKDNDPTWCQPLVNCPSRITRYEIRDGVRNPLDLSYYPVAETTTAQSKDPAFNEQFTPNKPTENVTVVGEMKNPQSGATKPEVLLNYIDHSTGSNIPNPPNCKDTLNVKDPPAPLPALTQADLLIADYTTNSFYACVDSARNIARVTIRGNSLRRLQTDANYNPNNPAFFPTATVQVQGLGVRGQ